MPPRNQTRPGDPPETTQPPADDAPAQDAAVDQATPADAPATAAVTSPTPETPAVTEPPAEPEAPEALAPAWNPDDVEIAGRPSALEASEEIAEQLGHEQRVETPTDHPEEA
jgi:hypothetical protein